ncbi:carboxypeptidase regulatory-like domain-containing protein [Candidatus Palauibacter sp.]|uniref:carboxypeptidase regulatory-like domain-containing protein n=1 Tax=Candidatus Palauibacter sp. TaxID=3101350 RepID=UPI003B01FEC5
MERWTVAGPASSTRAVVAGVAFAALHSLSGAGALAGQETQCDGAGLRIEVLDATGMVSASGADVRIRWTDAVHRPVRQGAGDDGRVTLCAPRDAMEATVWAEVRDGSSEQASVELMPGQTSAVELRILAEENAGRLEGRVFDAVTKDPITTAAVTVAGRATAVETDRWGRYILTGVPAGAKRLEVRRMGYEPLQYVVTVKPGLTTQVDTGLVPDPVEMEPLVATTVRSRRLEQQGFYERQYWGEMLGIGDFLAPEYLESWRPTDLGQLIAQQLGLPTRSRSNHRLTFQTVGDCLNVYRDNMRRSSASIERRVMPSEAVGVEVYRAPVPASLLPTGLPRYDERCNLVLIWTA